MVTMVGSAPLVYPVAVAELGRVILMTFPAEQSHGVVVSVDGDKLIYLFTINAATNEKGVWRTVGFMAVEAGQNIGWSVIGAPGNHILSIAVFPMFISGTYRVSTRSAPGKLFQVTLQRGGCNNVSAVMAVRAEGVVVRGQRAVCNWCAAGFIRGC